MANELDEITGPVNSAGRDINVIEKQLPARVGWGSTLFEIVLWCLCIIPGLIFLFMKIGAKNYFQQLQQKIQSDASTIDNYLEQGRAEADLGRKPLLDHVYVSARAVDGAGHFV